jgi:hypothetical protein
MTAPTIAIILVLIGLALILTGFRRSLQGHPGRRASRFIAGLLLTLMGASVALVGAGLHIYARLSYEQPVAQVKVTARDPSAKRYEVTVQSLAGDARETTCEIQGDEWLLSARVQTWKPWANLIGMNATYTLEQLANRYLSADEANANMITACDLARPNALYARLVPAAWQARLLEALQADERRFGSANYMPLADGALYLVFMTQNGLNAEPANDPARAANSARP